MAIMATSAVGRSWTVPAAPISNAIRKVPTICTAMAATGGVAGGLKSCLPGAQTFPKNWPNHSMPRPKAAGGSGQNRQPVHMRKKTGHG